MEKKSMTWTLGKPRKTRLELMAVIVKKMLKTIPLDFSYLQVILANLDQSQSKWFNSKSCPRPGVLTVRLTSLQRVL